MDLCQCDITILNYIWGGSVWVSITVDGVSVILSWGGHLIFILTGFVARSSLLGFVPSFSSGSRKLA